MPDIFTLTPQPVRVTALGYQPIYLALDVGGFDFMDVELGTVSIEGTGTSTVELWTGMQAQTDDGYVSVVAFTAQTTGNQWEKKSISSGLLRYLRWKVTAVPTTAVTFFIRGMGRRYS